MAKTSPLRFAEFFEAEDGRLSMTRLMVLMTWPPATYVLLYNPDQLANYLGFYVGGYAAGKAADAFTGGKNAVSNKVVETDSDSADSDNITNNGVSKRKGRVRS